MATLTIHLPDDVLQRMESDARERDMAIEDVACEMLTDRARLDAIVDEMIAEYGPVFVRLGQ